MVIRNAELDVEDGLVAIKTSKLYNLIDEKNGSGTHTLKLISNEPGVRFYTFTFG